MEVAARAESDHTSSHDDLPSEHNKVGTAEHSSNAGTVQTPPRLPVMEQHYSQGSEPPESGGLVRMRLSYSTSRCVYSDAVCIERLPSGWGVEHERCGGKAHQIVVGIYSEEAFMAP